MSVSETGVHALMAGRLAGLFAPLPQVQAVALGGSRSSGAVDVASDIDLYVYTRAEIPLETRRMIVERMGGARQANLGLDYWGPGDAWYDLQTGIEIDVVYFDASWMEQGLRRVIEDAQPSMGYTTCFWHTVAVSQPLYDPSGWFAGLQALARRPYPEALRRGIIALNHPLLRNIIPSYFHQVEKAVVRGDLLSINHRLAALFASYFDVLFALNRSLHPGEKRLLEWAAARCPTRPESMAEDVTAVLRAAGRGSQGLIQRLTLLLDRLDALLEREGFDPATSHLRGS